MKQISLPLRLALDPDFDNYLEQDNAPVVKAVRDSLASPAHVPLYIWGASGTGKTHLLRAALQYMTKQGLGVGQMGLSAVSSEPALGPSDPCRFDPAWSVVLFEDVHLFSQAQQQQAFAWMIHAQNTTCNVIATGSLPPVNLPLREDLRTRLAWGQVFALQPLSEANCRVVLRRQACARGIELSDEVLDYVMLRFSRDLVSLQRLLEKLDTYSLEAKRSVTVPLIGSMFRSIGSES